MIDVRRSIVLPDDCDPAAVAAAMNPAMSSWVALRKRMSFQAGQSVLVLGATGSAGRMALQVAKHLGAGRIVAAGRDAEHLAALSTLGATDTVAIGGSAPALTDALGSVAPDADVVVDYLWGEPAAAMAPLMTGRSDRAAPLT